MIPPPFSKGGNLFDFSCDCSMKFKNDTSFCPEDRKADDEGEFTKNIDNLVILT
jgi:hypothetical protein